MMLSPKAAVTQMTSNVVGDLTGASGAPDDTDDNGAGTLPAPTGPTNAQRANVAGLEKEIKQIKTEIVAKEMKTNDPATLETTKNNLMDEIVELKAKLNEKENQLSAVQTQNDAAWNNGTNLAATAMENAGKATEKKLQLIQEKVEAAEAQARAAATLKVSLEKDNQLDISLSCLILVKSVLMEIRIALMDFQFFWRSIEDQCNKMNEQGQRMVEFAKKGPASKTFALTYVGVSAMTWILTGTICAEAYDLMSVQWNGVADTFSNLPRTLADQKSLAYSNIGEIEENAITQRAAARAQQLALISQ